MRSPCLLEGPSCLSTKDFGASCQIIQWGPLVLHGMDRISLSTEGNVSCIKATLLVAGIGQTIHLHLNYRP